MSDVTVAPDASPPPVNEVPVNPAAPSLPTPIGSQTPEKVEAPPRLTTRREAIQNAFDKAEKAKNAKPADAKIGHNRPPEPTPLARPNGDPEKGTLDLRKRPTEQPEQPQRERAEHGHFAPRTAPATQAVPPLTQQRAPHPGAPRWHAPIPRMSQAAKADWAKTPDSVRADAHRLHDEFNRAYQHYRADHEEMNAIRPFQQMAREHGTTLQRALANYVSMEHKLRSDVVGGLDVIINNLNLTTPDGQRLKLEDVAWHIVNQTPEQRALLQSKNTAMAQSHQLQQMRYEQQALANELRRMHYAAAFGQTRAAVDQYATTHPRLDELGDLIEQEVKLGFPLDVAYRRAELLRPATAAQTRTDGTAAQTRTTSAQTRPTDRSISGAPGGPSNGAGRPRAQVSRRDAITSALKHVNGSL